VEYTSRPLGLDLGQSFNCRAAKVFVGFVFGHVKEKLLHVRSLPERCERADRFGANLLGYVVAPDLHEAVDSFRPKPRVAVEERERCGAEGRIGLVLEAFPERVLKLLVCQDVLGSLPILFAVVRTAEVVKERFQEGRIRLLIDESKNLIQSLVAAVRQQAANRGDLVADSGPARVFESLFEVVVLVLNREGRGARGVDPF
jgi:hypothetical protein